MYRILVPVVLLGIAVGAVVMENRTEPSWNTNGTQVASNIPLLDSSRFRPTEQSAAPEASAGITTTLPVTAEGVPVIEGLPEEIPELSGSQVQILAQQLGEIIAGLPGDFRACLVVRERESRQVNGSEENRLGAIYSHNPDLSLIPASNQKLATAATALLQLGPDYRFTTRVLASGLPQGDTHYGDLYLIGGGDPLLYTESYLRTFIEQPSVFTPVEELAQATYDRGIRRIVGSIVAVPNRYDNKREASQLRGAVPYRYVGPLSAMLINDGYQNYDALGDTGINPEPASDPSRFAAAEFDDLLEALGMVITTRPRVIAANEDISGFIEIARLESAPLSELLLSLLTDSDNTTSELLLKEVAANYSAAQALAAQTQNRDLSVPELQFVEPDEVEEIGAEEPGTDGLGTDQAGTEFEETTEQDGATEESVPEIASPPENTDPPVIVIAPEAEELEAGVEEAGVLETGEQEAELTGDDTEEPQRLIPAVESPEGLAVTAQPGSTAEGVRLVEQLLTQVGISSWQGVPRDGSGLDSWNSMSCAAAADILDFFGPKSEISDALAKAGETGTLEARYAGSDLVGRMRGKTGSLPGVTTLSGFFDADQSRTLTFSFFTNHGYAPSDEQRAVQAQRRVMQALLDYLDS